jgi:colanic acid/amylovoran biosynthesis glycosyltransferase
MIAYAWSSMVFGVAQFRRELFRASETFIYNYFTAFRRIVPVGISFWNENLDRFPLAHPLVPLFPWMSHRFSKQIIWDWFFGGGFFLPRTFAAFQHHNVRVMHAHFGPTGVQVLPVKHATGLPLVTTFYGFDMSRLTRSARWRRAYARLFHTGELFLTEGAYMRDRLIDLGCPPEKAQIQRIAIHLDRYPFRARQAPAAPTPARLLFCGHFAEKKGLLYALDAVQRAARHFPNLEFRIIGDGLQRPQVEAMLDRYQMRGYTRLLGYQPHERMIAEMQAADIFLSPSVTGPDGDSEGGAPTTLLEAQACGLPIVSSYHADIPNVVVPGESALLAPERAVEVLAEHLCTLLGAPEQWAAMGQRGRAFVDEYHDIQREAARLEERYFALAALAAS